MWTHDGLLIAILYILPELLTEVMRATLKPLIWTRRFTYVDDNYALN